MKMIILAAMIAAILAGCTPNQEAALDAAELVVENRVDHSVDRLIQRICKGPIDVAVRTAERYPAVGRAMFDTCPETYGRLRAMIFADALQRLARPSPVAVLEDVFILPEPAAPKIEDADTQ